MSIRNAYRQGYKSAEIGCDDENPYKRMNKVRDAYAWDRGFNDSKNGMVYQPPYSQGEFQGVRIEHSEYKTKAKPCLWK